MLPACTGYLHKQSLRSLFEFFKVFFTLLLFHFLFRSSEFVRLSHSLINTVCVTVLQYVDQFSEGQMHRNLQTYVLCLLDCRSINYIVGCIPPFTS